MSDLSGAKVGDKLAPKRGLKYDATRMEIVNDFYNEVQVLFAKYRYNREAILALAEIEDIAIWWANTPAVIRPKDP